MGKFAYLVQEGKLLPKDADVVRDNLLDTLEDQDEHLEVRRRSMEAVAPFTTGAIQEYVSWTYNSDDLKLKSNCVPRVPVCSGQFRLVRRPGG